VQVRIVRRIQGAIGVISNHLDVFLGGGLRGIPSRRFHGDTGREYSSKVSNAQEEDKEHGEDESELDECLPPEMTVGWAASWPPKVSQ
jgi:hypothetical protein